MTCSECLPRLVATDPLPHWSTEDKHPGWFSRRHQTRDANNAAREKYQANRGRAARQRKAQEGTS